MTTNRYSAFAPIGLNFHNTQPSTVIRNLTSAARVLIQDCPLDDGEDYVIAVNACADALVGERSPEELRQALLKVANEAGISALSLVQDEGCEVSGLSHFGRCTGSEVSSLLVAHPSGGEIL
ncbi:hypothetical protein GCM10010520_11760 [Rhizobium viscosum]|uniref:DUF982 domain-containing protein n=1 Tax=Rhizobium viscosum TaxID=1673 RepID=A0ABR9IYH9_RHIVS|nr:DUF982 domain-containing protein [Rhizobium viscosum]MBE1508279.1 hypothetical protein [Rhizobium viscosum]